jgi:thioredoxin reductase (NADPH)
MNPPKLQLFGALWCPDSRRTRQFLDEHRIPYFWIDVTDNNDALALLEQLAQGPPRTPTLLLPGGDRLVAPSKIELAAKLGLHTEATNKFYDLAIVGAGPAGLTAAIYAARDGLGVLVVERGRVGGQAALTSVLDNFPGFPDGISGEDFADRLRRQAERFNVEIVRTQNVVGIEPTNHHFDLTTERGDSVGARSVLVATGSRYRRLGIPGEEDFLGAGVHFCATTDGPSYRGRPVAVIGGGNSAAEESLFLAQFASRVTVFVRGGAFQATRVIVDKVESTPTIEVRYDTEIRAFHGNRKFESMVVRDRISGREEDFPADAVFVFIGLEPNSGWLPPGIARDKYGFVLTNPNLETTLPGVFAAGDVRSGSVKQAASAAGEGTAAALMIREYLTGQADLIPKTPAA